MTDTQRRVVAEGIAAMAVTLAEMGATEDEARVKILAMLQQVGPADAEIVREAAACIGQMPQPLNESAEEVERARPIREMLGVTSAEEQLTAALTGREWLEHLAADLGG